MAKLSENRKAAAEVVALRALVRRLRAELRELKSTTGQTSK